MSCVAICSSGCAIYTPYQIFRFTADYNTERRWSMQTEVLEHIPPYPVRVRMNRWAYNVGPQTTSATIPIPTDSPVSPPNLPQGMIAPPLPPSPGLSEDDLLEESRPPELAPTSPRVDLRSEEGSNGRMGPSARANVGVRGASYQVPSRSPTQPPTPTGAWLFGN